MATDRVHHPLFARIYARVSGKAEQKGQAEHRRELLEGLEGRVIELGAGHGLNFDKYPPAVSEVIAVEPEAHLRRGAEARAREAPVPIRVVAGVADALPADDGSMDAAVASLVLCSVPDQRTALAEIQRVLRPGGELRFYEHVQARSPGLGRLQRLLDRTRFWPLVAGGCHASRHTVEAIEEAGFEVESCRRFRFAPELVERVTAPKVLGVARRR